VLSAPALAQIRIGLHSEFTGSVAPGVKENADEARLCFDGVNAAGGVAGQAIELISVDDKFDPKLTGELGRKLIVEDNVVALFLNRGTPHSQALLPVIERFKVPQIAPSTGAMPELRKAKLEPLFLEKLDRAKPGVAALAARVAKREPQALLFIAWADTLAAGTRAIREAGSRARWSRCPTTRRRASSRCSASTGTA